MACHAWDTLMKQSLKLAGYSLSALLLFGGPLQAEPLVLVGDDFCPYNCEDSGNYQGYMVDLLTRIYSEQGYQVEYHLTPWSRALQMVRSGSADILLANTSANSPDPALAYVLGEDSTCFFTRADTQWRYSDLASLQAMRLGVIQDYHYDDIGPLDEYIRGNIEDHSKVVSAKGPHALSNNFRMLVAKRLDVVLENCNVGSSALRRLDLAAKVIPAGNMSGYRDDLHVSFAPANPQSAARMQLLKEGVERLRANKQLAPILDKYAVRDWLAAPASQTAPAGSASAAQ
jgi:polar amino acid transport system substrate-binding protein